MLIRPVSRLSNKSQVRSAANKVSIRAGGILVSQFDNIGGAIVELAAIQ